MAVNPIRLCLGCTLPKLMADFDAKISNFGVEITFLDPDS
jgi:hypothetical protein